MAFVLPLFVLPTIGLGLGVGYTRSSLLPAERRRPTPRQAALPPRGAHGLCARARMPGADHARRDTPTAARGGAGGDGAARQARGRQRGGGGACRFITRAAPWPCLFHAALGLVRCAPGRSEAAQEPSAARSEQQQAQPQRSVLPWGPAAGSGGLGRSVPCRLARWLTPPGPPRPLQARQHTQQPCRALCARASS